MDTLKLRPVGSSEGCFTVDPTGRILFGRYALGPRLGSGGMGVVYKARDLKVGRDVALKILRCSEPADSNRPSVFQTEIRAFAELDHPHIVPIYEADEREGLNYFTMKLLPTDLRAQRERFSGKPRSAALLVEKIALAVEHVHRRRILHRDLKPANILLDSADPPNPYVADFGVAKALGADGQVHHTGVIVGTPAYMAPEQAAGVPATHAADVYSLGVILYELLVQAPPFCGDAEEIARAQRCPPKNPCSLAQHVDRELALICLRCLELEPAERYPSAQALALELRRYLNGEPVDGTGAARRAWRWISRYPLVTALLLGLSIFVIVMTVGAVSLIREQESAQRAQIREVNTHRATMVAGKVLAQLRAQSDAVEHAAADADLIAAIERNDRLALMRFCHRTYLFYEDPAHGLRPNAHSPSPFNLWLVLDKDGILQAQDGKWRHKLPLGSPYDWRDYFVGARAHALHGVRSAHISRVFRGESDGHFKFAVSAPIYGHGGRLAGVLTAGIAAEADLGSLGLDDPRSVAVLVAPLDRERNSPIPRFSHVIFRHPALAYGEAVATDLAQLHQVGAVDSNRPALWPADPRRTTALEDYHDPMADAYDRLLYGGSWSAGFAPIGNTGFIVIVQSRMGEALLSELSLMWNLVRWMGLSTAPLAMLLSIAFGYKLRRRRALRH